MAVDCQNIYKNARKSAGMTQEKAAQLLNVSVDSLRDYEQSQRPVPSDVASAMCDVYQAPYLAVQHLRRSSELGKRVVPEIQLKDLPEAVLGVLAAVQRFVVRIHDLRHSHVSLLIEMGFSALAIADRVGHESVDITYKYAHLFPSKQQELAQKLDMERREG